MTPSATVGEVAAKLAATPGIAGTMPTQVAADGSGWSMIQAVPAVDCSPSRRPW
ncbi:hypothetical protein [Kitasatospora sp. LaBMicrA B282]|uniref:hypothetical protein n=1 Tax=Kitasatospora sp. LaBMicrA B282 TaxID=3420949 RepID=UPI003D130DF2